MAAPAGEAPAGKASLTIREVRALLAQNTLEGVLDPELAAALDGRVDYDLFFAGDSVYTRGELESRFPLKEFRLTPEALFVRQEFVWPAPAEASEDWTSEDEAGVESGPTMHDMLPGLAPQRGSHIFLGKELWEDFLLLRRMVRGAAGIAAAGGLALGPLAPAPAALEAAPARAAPLAPARAAPPAPARDNLVPRNKTRRPGSA